MLAALLMMIAGLHPASAGNVVYDLVRLEPLLVGSASEQTTIVVTLEVLPGDKPAAQALAPRLAEAFRQQLHAQPTGTMPDVWHIQVCLMTAAGLTAPPGLIHDMRIDVVQGRT
jgi:hypothetical protein